ncbi:hypothetical protein DOH45_26215, partial [Salmonella enterica subsp. enterica serovar Enteritidis]|nr:hypothetical protein [Salmonella enterica subsp. enterica serovar Enteritidis]
LAASGWLFIEDSLEQGARPWSGGGFGKVASCPEGWQAAMLDAVDRLSADVADSVVWLEILGPLCGPSRHKAAPTGNRDRLVGAALCRDGGRSPPGFLQAKKAPPIGGVEVRAWQLEKGTAPRKEGQRAALQQHGADIAQHVAQALGEARG